MRREIVLYSPTYGHAVLIFIRWRDGKSILTIEFGKQSLDRDLEMVRQKLKRWFESILAGVRQPLPGDWVFISLDRFEFAQSGIKAVGFLSEML